MNSRLRIWYVLPICLFLISMGVRVPSLVGPHTPNHHPRAVFETGCRSSQDVSTENVVVAELRDTLPAPRSPQLSRARFDRETCRFKSTTLPQSGARAPPAPIL